MTIKTRANKRQWVARHIAGLCALAVAVGLTVAVTGPAQAELRIDITRGEVQPMPIAVTRFPGESVAETEVGQNITQVISDDLARSGLFRPIEERAFIQSASSLAVSPNFAEWRAISAQALVNGRIVTEPNGLLRVEFRLWDVLAENQMAGMAYRTQPDNWRRIAHKIADEIYKRITGESGYFDTRVVYVSESGPAQSRIKRLAIMDQDGANHRFLSDGRFLVLNPRFSPTAQEVVYMSYFNDKPRVYVLDIDTAELELLGDFPGMTFAPRFSPDGNSVIMSQALDGNSEIYTLDLRTREKRQLTRHPAVDTSPSYSPDGSRVAFNSDRSGGQQIYVMNADGSGVQRISFGGGLYATPVWSPRGDLIAFTKSQGGRFYIGVMRTDGSGERLLAEGFLVEGPTWAPNGRVLMYHRQNPSRDGTKDTFRLFSIDLTGFNEREIVTPADGSDPAWSPLIP
ncbi:Tol-Pal system beta propeller repeat protein TolB [Thalassospira sp.]|uniref:Tol-Pal system beta propeller repeat protein TolB n=1 Tax=Thalassospira sp. TaxID=1912094 RepID=UPI00273545E5|nr:Tol-Pal system beta propeller repeat protein TolB [Thalassospira sp.]MDP2697113.1 Tol-Pal system beta propeller repeat protein TolB [Thalassospira sp.]